MDEHLVGYLLNALDKDTHREVETYLRGHPEAQRRLGVLRKALSPLGADAESPKPPPGLVLRTLSFVAEHGGRELPRPPAPPVLPFTPVARRSWRRVDVLVAAGLLLVASLLLLPAVNKLVDRQQVLACQNNLRLLHNALATYSDQNEDSFPKVEPEAPRRNFAGVYVPALYGQGVLSPEVSISCPPNGRQPAPTVTLPELETMAPEVFQQWAGSLGGGYAYTLGYRDAEGRLKGFRRDDAPDFTFTPILADRPPVAGLGNSPNHGGTGQNVLFVGGNVRFSTTRTVGPDNDIYVNKDGFIAAGRDERDTVLGASGAHP